MNRNQTPVAFLGSVLIHVMVLFAAARWLGGSRPVPHAEPEAPTTPIARVVFPPSEVWRPPAPPTQARPAAPPPSRPDRPNLPEPPPPPPREPKDRVSIGGPSPERQKTPLELRRDEDLSRRVAKGRPDAAGTSPVPVRRAPTPQPTAPPDPQVASGDPAIEEGPATDPSRTEPDGDRAPVQSASSRSAPVTGPTPPPGAPSIAESLRTLNDRIEGPVGLESGAGQQMGDLFFDPQGADFTEWTNVFRNEVYRNWIVPQSVRFGARGHVLIEFRIERDGRLSGLRIVRSSGTPALDRAAANALRGGRFAPLPADYRPPQLAIQVAFFYNEGRR